MKEFLKLLSKGQYTGIALFALLVVSGVMGRIVERISVTAKNLDNEIIELYSSLAIIATGLFIVWVIVALVIFVTLRDLGIIAKPKAPRKRKK